MDIKVLKQQLETDRKKIKIMEHALSASAGAYYNINITRNLIPGTMYKVIDDVEYSINEAIGFPDNCKYWDVIEYWGNQLDEESKQYWTKDSLGNPMLAEQRRRLEEDIIRIEGLASQYSTLYFINLDNKEYSKYVISGNVRWESIESESKDSKGFFSTYKKVILACSHPDFRDELLKFADENYVREILCKRKRYSYRFLYMGKDGKYFWLKLVLIKFNDVEEGACRCTCSC